MGIDPGYSGAIALSGDSGDIVDIIRLKETEHDISTFVSGYAADVVAAVLERVSAMPKQGVSSTFKFGVSFGFCRGLLVCHRIPFSLVPPGTWQRSMQCLTRGDKNVTKAAAQRLWPSEKVVHATADAMLLSEYARRQHL